MKIGYSKQFIKSAKKLSEKEKLQLHARISMFAKHPTHPLLRNHALSGAYKQYRSINITGDIRALYLSVSEQEVVFDIVGTHSQLYG